MEEMKVGLMYGTSFVFTFFFVGIYSCMISEKSIKSGAMYGALFGLALGVSMGFGSYSYMPIPLMLAWAWFIGTLVQSIVAGVIAGAIVRETPA
ncbi:MAG TPA: hypothetical protein ENJ01_00825 [Gammaproteobacteria bacterium]|nr:hypothetical protein [Gammaproteobacteria bacterium]